MIEKIENILIGISRYFLIFIGAFAFISSILVLLYSITLIADRPNLPSSKIDAPTYNDFKSSLFPKKTVTAKPSIKQSNSIETLSTPQTNNQKPVDQVYKDLRMAISFQFNDSQEMIDSFTANVTPRSLDTYISDQYLSNMSYAHRQNSLDSLVSLFNDIKDINDFKKIGSFDSRLEIVSKLINSFYIEFYDSIDLKELQKSRAINKSTSNNASGYANLIYVLYALAIYAAAVLYLMIFKVEIDLRKIPPAIKNEKT